MIALLGILIVIWLVSSNIKWMMIAFVGFMLLVNGCRRNRDEVPEPPQPQPTFETRQMSATGLPISDKRYYAAKPGMLMNGEEW